MTLAQPWFTAAAAAAASGIPVLAPATRADARPAASPAVGPAASRACPPAGVAVSFSDSLDKLVYHGVELGGLSSLAWDPRSADWVSAVDNHGTDPARIWFFRNLAHPTVIRDPLVLRKPDGTAYDGTNSDNEGLAVLPDGDYLVSSETEPSIRIYGRDGVQKASLPVPARFAVTGTTPEGQATSNATLEGSRSRVPAARSSRPWRAPCPATFRPAVTRPCTASSSMTMTGTGTGNRPGRSPIGPRPATASPRSKPTAVTPCSWRRPRSPPRPATPKSSTRSPTPRRRRT